MSNAELKQVKITFSFQLPYYIGLFLASDHSHRDCPIIEIPDGNIRIERIEEKTPFSRSSGYEIISKSIIHIEMLRSVGDTPDLNCIEKIYIEAFKILISFLQLFRLRTREFAVKPTEICGPLSLHEDIRFSGHLITYNPQGIKKIDVNCEPECDVGADAIRNALRYLVGEEMHGRNGAWCNELK